MIKKMLSDRKGVAIELAILMTAVCLAVTTIVLSTALLQYEHKVRAEQQMEENIILEQIVEMWLEDPQNGISYYKGYCGLKEDKGSVRTLYIHKADKNHAPIPDQILLTVVIDTINGTITSWKKG